MNGPDDSGKSYPVSVVEITRHEEFLDLQSEWDRLAGLDPDASVFLTHEWVDAAWAWRRNDAAPLILAIRRDAEIIGLVPLLTHKNGTRAPILEWLAVPDNQECGLVCRPHELAIVTEAFAGWLTTQRTRWSRLRLTHLCYESPLLPALLHCLHDQGIPVRSKATGINHSIELSGGWDAFYATRSRRLKKGNNLVANRLTRAGDVAVHRLTGARITPGVRDTLRALSATSWKRSTGTTFDQVGPGAFLETLCTRGRDGHWLVVWLLTLDDQPIAAELHVEGNGRVHGLRSDYADQAAELSPGTYLNWKIIERLFESGNQRYELGPGENPYKQRWTNDGLRLMTVDAWPPTVTGRLAATWHDRVRPFLAGLKQRVTTLPGRKGSEPES